MSHTTFRALSDVYGKITSLAAITKDSIGSDASTISHNSTHQLAGIAQVFADAQLHVLGFYDLPQQQGGRGGSRQRLYSMDFTDRPSNIAVHPIPAQKMLRLGGTPNDIHAVEPPQLFQPSIWIQDGFSVLQGNDGSIALLDSIYYKFYNTENPAPYFMAEVLSTLDGIVLKPFLYSFLGSNILTDGISYAFINGATLPNTLQDGEQEEIETAFRIALGVPYIFWLGDRATAKETNLFSLLYAKPKSIPIPRNNLLRSNHLDMYVTLGGRYTDSNTTKELVFIAEITDESTVTDGTIDKQVIENTIKDTNDFLATIAAQIRACSTDSLVFEVVRIPIIADFRNNSKNLRPYNNCHVEVYGTTKNVYLPQYIEYNTEGKNIFDPIETEVKRIFGQYGFHPIMVDNDFMEHSNAGGSLHCIIKILSREEYTP